MQQVLIIGDSQTHTVGKVLQNLLRGKGDTVTRIPLSGYSTSKLFTYAKDKISPDQYQLVYIFAGGNDYKPTPALVMSFANFFKNAKVVWVGPPPATRISDLSKARKVFGSKVSGPDYWIKTGLFDKRNKTNEVYKKAIAQTDAFYADPRSLLPDFPSQPDGIHVQGESAMKIAEKLQDYPPGFPLIPLAIAAFVLKRLLT